MYAVPWGNSVINPTQEVNKQRKQIQLLIYAVFIQSVCKAI